MHASVDDVSTLTPSPRLSSDGGGTGNAAVVAGGGRDSSSGDVADGPVEGTTPPLSFSYSPVLLSLLPPPPPLAHAAIRDLLVEGRGIATPRPFQIKTAYYVACRKLRLTIVVRQCGEGKSEVLYACARLLRGVVLCEVPIIGLGSDQVSKTE